MHNKKRLDKIAIHDLSLNCIIGIYNKERVRKQNVNINLALYADLSRACKSDAIEDTVNYKTIKNNIRDAIRKSQFFLIERMADTIAEICFQESFVEEVTVRVEKPGALTLARTVSIEIHRRREEYDA